MKGIVTGLAVWAAFNAAGVEPGRDVRRAYPCYRMDQAPVMDGKLDDPAWRGVPAATGFVVMGSGAFAAKQSGFQMGYDEESLYVGVRCEEPDMPQLVAQCADGDVRMWQEDSVELLLLPVGSKDAAHFMVNAIGSRWGERGGATETVALGNWRAKTWRGNDFYSVEIAIPWRIFGGVPGQNAVWRGNLCRNTLTAGDRFTSWARVIDSFSQPLEFARIIFRNEPLPASKRERVEKEVNQEVREDLRRELQRGLALLATRKGDLRMVITTASGRGQTETLPGRIEEVEKKCRQTESCALAQLDILLRRVKDLLRECDQALRETDHDRGRMLLERLFDKDGE